MKVVKPPTPLPPPEAGELRVFLAGSIEGGLAAPWQEEIQQHLSRHPRAGTLVVLNPRREAWDAAWEQRLDNPVFRAQVEWELEGLEQADVVAVHLAAGTRSPVSLLELGLHARRGRLVVSCPEGFWRKGNVEVVGARFGFAVHGTWTAFLAALDAAVAAR